MHEKGTFWESHIMNDRSTETSGEPKPQRVEARATKDPAVRMFIFAALLLAFGIYCFIDAYIRHKYPHQPFSESLNAWSKWAFNHIGPFVFVPVGLVALAWGIFFLRRKLLADPEGIGYLGKEKIPWDQVTKLDATRLQSKGVLHLYCGEAKKLTLDSWKLESFRDLVALVERHVAPDRIRR